MDQISIDWTMVIQHCVTLVVAFIPAIPIGWARESAERSAALSPMGAIGLAVAARRLEFAIWFSISGLATLRFLKPAKQAVAEDDT
jgi:uncharacterized membrane protein YhiD involved in acid resistance